MSFCEISNQTVLRSSAAGTHHICGGITWVTATFSVKLGSSCEGFSWLLPFGGNGAYQLIHHGRRPTGPDSQNHLGSLS